MYTWVVHLERMLEAKPAFAAARLEVQHSQLAALPLVGTFPFEYYSLQEVVVLNL